MTGKPAKDAEPAIEKPTVREPTEWEVAAIKAAARSYLERPTRASLTLKSDPAGALTISNPHADGKGWNVHLADTFGTSSDAFANQSFVRVATAVADRKAPLTEMQANAALALMGAIAPANELEAVIGEQIIAAHAASLDFLSRARLNAGEYVNTAVAYANAATKLTRTMGALVETLTKLRSGGRQRIEVVYVNGPAVIGDNAQTVIAGEGGDGSTIVGQPHATGALARLAAAPCLPMRREDTQGDALSVSGRTGSEAVPHARGPESGRADGAG